MSGPLPLLGLRAFVEVGRNGSMKAAADRLGVTPGAVSQQVKALESRLAAKLFERRNRELRLTPNGTRLLANVGDAFDRLETALEEAERPAKPRRSRLVVSTTGSFAANWLVPRLGRFAALYPDTEVEILTGTDLVPVGTGPGDAQIAIRHGLGAWAGLDAIPLLRPRLLPVGTPVLLGNGPPIRTCQDCLLYPLLHDAEAADWRLWFQALGQDHRDPRLGQGSRFGDSVLLTQAAIAGLGLALIRDTYVTDEIGAGRLKIAIDAPWPAEFAYYVVTRPGPRRPQIENFTRWLLTEAIPTG